MAKFLEQNGGQIREVQPVTTSAGAGDAGKIAQLDSTGRFDSSLMPTGIGADTEVMVASEALNAGDLVNVWNDSGTRKARKADASNSRRAHGFVVSGFALNASATIYFSGDITGLTSLTAGEARYLSGTTAGATTATAPTTSGQITQEVGTAVSSTVISFRPMQPITLV